MIQKLHETIEEIAARKAETARLRALVGAPLAQEVLAIIQENEERWHQSSWRHENVEKWDVELDRYEGTDPEILACDVPATAIEAYIEDPLHPSCTTAFCLAGWVGAVKGVKWAKGDNKETIGNPEVCNCVGLCCVNSSHQMSIGTYARIQLGISESAADRLFNGDNRIEHLEAGVQAIVEGRGGVRYAIDQVDSYYDDDDDDADSEDVDDDDE